MHNTNDDDNADDVVMEDEQQEQEDATTTTRQPAPESRDNLSTRQEMIDELVRPELDIRLVDNMQAADARAAASNNPMDGVAAITNFVIYLMSTKAAHSPAGTAMYGSFVRNCTDEAAAALRDFFARRPWIPVNMQQRGVDELFVTWGPVLPEL